jgi:PKHD-type hydroxylase
MAEPLVERPLLPHAERAPYSSYELHHGVFTPKQCQRIIERGLQEQASEGGLEGVDGDEVLDTTVRDSTTAWLPPADDTDWIYSKLARVAQKANRRYEFALTGFEENLQFTVYDRPGAFYTWHQDGLDGPVAHRKLSMVVQLTDPEQYRGAELQFFDVAEDYDEELLDAFTESSTRQGTVVVFPSLEYHRVLPLRSGVRYSLVSWVSGPAFR